MTQDSYISANKFSQIIDFFEYPEADVLKLAGLNAQFFDTCNERLRREDIRKLFFCQGLS